MSRGAATRRTCDERICVDTDTRPVLFPDGTERHYCRLHIDPVLAHTDAEVITHA